MSVGAFWGTGFWNALAEYDEQAEQKEKNYAQKEIIEENITAEMNTEIDWITKVINVEFAAAKSAFLKVKNDKTEAVICILEKKENKGIRSDVEIVMQQTNSGSNKALLALLKHKYDIVDAIIEIVNN